MKFFIPETQDAAHELCVYSAIKELLGKELGAVFDERKVRSLRYVQGGKEYYAEVGSPHYLNGETVIVILHEPQRSLYHICTTNRGVVRETSIFVVEGFVRAVEDFNA